MRLKNYRPKTFRSPVRCHPGLFVCSKDRGAAAKTIIGYQSILRLLADGLPPKINVHEITEKEVRKHLSKYDKPASRNATIRHLRAFFRWTATRGWREGDPTEQTDKTREIDEQTNHFTLGIRAAIPDDGKLLEQWMTRGLPKVDSRMACAR